MNIKPVIDLTKNGYHFRTICESDKELFMGLRKETSDIAAAYKKFEDFVDFSWSQDLIDENNVFMMVFRETDDQFVATCSFQGLNKEAVELGYDVVAEYRGQGLGTAVVKELISLAHSCFPEKQIIIRIRKENIASRRVAEKSGGKQIGFDDTPGSMYLQKMIDQHKDEPDLKGRLDFDEMQATADQGKNGVLIFEV